MSQAYGVPGEGQEGQEEATGGTLLVTALDKCCACGGGLVMNTPAPSLSDAPSPPPPPLQEAGALPDRYAVWQGSTERPARVDVSGGLLISPYDYALFMRALLPTVDPPEGHEGDPDLFKSLLSDRSRVQGAACRE